MPEPLSIWGFGGTVPEKLKFCAHMCVFYMRLGFSLLLYHHHVLLRHVGSNTEHTKHNIRRQIHPLKTQLKTYKRRIQTENTQKNTRRHAVYTLFNCAGECFPYSTFYCLLVDVNRRQTIQASNGNKSLWYQAWQGKQYAIIRSKQFVPIQKFSLMNQM